MHHITLFESFVREESSNIYEADKMDSDYTGLFLKNQKIKKEILKTWISDYVVPMMDFNLDEENPEYKSLISSAKSWLRAYSGVTSIDKQTGKQLRWTNGEIVHELYFEYRNIKKDRNRFPLTASMYDLIKGKSA